MLGSGAAAQPQQEAALRPFTVVGDAIPLAHAALDTHRAAQIGKPAIERAVFVVVLVGVVAADSSDDKVIAISRPGFEKFQVDEGGVDGAGELWELLDEGLRLVDHLHLPHPCALQALDERAEAVVVGGVEEDDGSPGVSRPHPRPDSEVDADKDEVAALRENPPVRLDATNGVFAGEEGVGLVFGPDRDVGDLCYLVEEGQRMPLAPAIGAAHHVDEVDRGWHGLWRLMGG